jgi:hypothetical protein
MDPAESQQAAKMQVGVLKFPRAVIRALAWSVRWCFVAFFILYE